MSRLLRGWRAWALALAFALVAGAATFAYTSAGAREAQLRLGPVTNDRALLAAEGLREDLARSGGSSDPKSPDGTGRPDHGVYVAPEARGLISQKQVTELRRVMQDSPVPIMFVAWLRPAESGLYIYGHDEIAIALDRPAVYVIWDGPGKFHTSAIGTQPGFPGSVSPTGDPVARMRDLVAELRANDEVVGTRTDFVDAVAGPEDNNDYWGGPGAATFLGALFGVGVGLAGLIVVALLGFCWRRIRITPLRSTT